MRALNMRQMAMTLQETGAQVRSLWEDDLGAATVEYAMLVAIIVVGSAGAWAGLHTALMRAFTRTIAAISSSGTTP